MEGFGIGQENRNEDVRVRRPYHTPQLVSLGEIQSIIQSGLGNVNYDAAMHSNSDSPS